MEGFLVFELYGETNYFSIKEDIEIYIEIYKDKKSFSNIGRIIQ